VTLASAILSQFTHVADRRHIMTIDERWNRWMKNHQPSTQLMTKPTITCHSSLSNGTDDRKLAESRVDKLKWLEVGSAASNCSTVTGLWQVDSSIWRTSWSATDCSSAVFYHTHTDILTVRNTDRQTDGHTDKQTDKWTDRHIDSEEQRQTDRQFVCIFNQSSIDLGSSDFHL